MWPGWSPLPWLWPLGLKREEVSVALRVGGGKFGKGRERLAGEGSFPAIGCVYHIIKNSRASFLTEEGCMGGGGGWGPRPKLLFQGTVL